MSVESVGSFR